MRFLTTTRVCCLLSVVCSDAYVNNASPSSFFPQAFQSDGAVKPLDGIPLSSGMLGNLIPRISNLELGFQYYFGNKARTGQVSGDYLLPISLSNDSVLFGEAHGNYWDFGQKPPGGTNNRVDLSVGGGFRKMMNDGLLFGVNGFYDSSRLFSKWYSSGGVGLEMAANVSGSDAIDLNLNWYGDLFSSDSILNAFRNKGGSYDIEAGYSHALFNQALDLRLKLAAYQFDVGNNVYGYKTGADLTTRDGVFTLRYEYGNDRVNGAWNTIGGFVNIGFQLENVLKGESPMTMPEPIFKSPRNLRRMLTQKVKRDWNQPYGMVGAGGSCSTTRFFGTVNMKLYSVGGPEWIFDTPDGGLHFDPVPLACLDPGKKIIVSFHWKFGNPISGPLKPYGEVDNNSRGVFLPPQTWSGQEGDGAILSRDTQQVFFDGGGDPNLLQIIMVELGLPPFTGGSLVLSNVTIRFNQ